MTFFQKKSTAVLTCLLLVAAALLFGAHRSLGALRRQATDVYVKGDDSGLSILAHLNSTVEYTSTLVKTAGGYYTAENAAFAAVQTANDRLRTDSADPAAARAALSDLMSACTLLQADYQGRTDIPQEDIRLMNRCINDMISMKDQMRHSRYNELAADFNDTLAGFPAGLLSSLTGIRALPLF